MCYLLFKPAGKPVNPEWIDNAFHAGNEHGLGFAYMRKGKPVIYKTLCLTSFLRELNTIPDDANAIIHLRMASQGRICEENAHPFAFGDLVGAHNGCLFGYGDADTTDTEDFFRREVWGSENLQKNWLNLEKSIGSGKMLFLDRSGHSYILNESKGEWHEGCWHSNSYYMGGFNRGFYGGDTEQDDGNAELSKLVDALWTIDAWLLPTSLQKPFNELLSKAETALYSPTIDGQEYL